jgi:hypothetical protein
MIAQFLDRARSADPMNGLTSAEVNVLAIYNSEVARGIVHTDEWKSQMSVLQERFNKRITA